MALIACDPDEVPPVNPPAPVAPAPVNTAPTAVIGADRTTIEEGDTFDLTAGTSSDPENNALTYQWVQLSGPDLGITDRNVETLTLQVSDVDQDETAEFELTVSDGSLTDAASVTMTFANVDQTPKLNAPTFQTPPTELRFDGPVRLIQTILFTEAFSVLPKFSNFLPVVANTPSGEELRAITIPGPGDEIGFSVAASATPPGGPKISEQHVDRYSMRSGRVGNLVVNATFPRIGVTLDIATNDIIVFSYINQNTSQARDLARGQVPNACKYIGEIEFNGVPHPSEIRRYYAVALTEGGLSLWSTESNFNTARVAISVPEDLTPGLRFEGDFFTNKAFCGPTQISTSSAVDGLTVFDSENRDLRRYEFRSNGSLASVSLFEFLDRAVTINFGSVPNLEYIDGFIWTRPDILVSIWSDGKRDGEHRLVTIQKDGTIDIKEWDKGVPERVRLSQVGFTPVNELPVFRFPPRPNSRFREPIDIIVFTPNTPNLVVFRTNSYGFEINEPSSSGSSRVVLLFNDEFPIADAQYVDVGLGATDLARLIGSSTFEDHIILFRRDQNKLQRYKRIAIDNP